MSRLVLDLRSGHHNSTHGMRLTNAVASGGVAGYRVESQLRTKNKAKVLAVRLSAPDGRVLDLLAEPHRSPYNSISPVTYALSAQVGYVFRSRLSDRQQAEAAEAIEAAITAGLSCLRDGTEGHDARVIVQSAALGLDADQVRTFLDEHAALLVEAGQFMPRDGEPKTDLTPVKVGFLLDGGFTPQETLEWFPMAYNVSGRHHVVAMGHFRDNGWTPAEIEALTEVLVRRGPRAGAALAKPDVDSWCRFTPRQALAAARAGCTAAGTRAMLRNGTFDEDALEVLGGLLRDPLSASSLAS